MIEPIANPIAVMYPMCASSSCRSMSTPSVDGCVEAAIVKRLGRAPTTGRAHAPQSQPTVTGTASALSQMPCTGEIPKPTVIYIAHRTGLYVGAALAVDFYEAA